MPDKYEDALETLLDIYTDMVCDEHYYTLCKVCYVRLCGHKPDKEKCKKRIKEKLLNETN